MRWKLKSLIQNAVAKLPPGISYAVYYWLQRNFGDLRTIDPYRRLKAGIASWRHVLSSGKDPRGKVFFEVGTGRVPKTALAYWLMGAKKTITIDLNPYMKTELIKEALQIIKENRSAIENEFGELLDSKRMTALVKFCQKNRFSTKAFLDLCGIEYIAPGDAAHTDLPDQSVDFHVSYNVMEHISENIIRDIFMEGKRILREDGLFIHKIDYSDHFAHADDKIPLFNFYRFSDEEWKKYSGNRFMYMNRLRHDDWLYLFENLRLRILYQRTSSDQGTPGLIANGGLPVNEKFHGKSPETLATTGAWFVLDVA